MRSHKLYSLYFIARSELWILCFLAFGVNYMLRVNINIAIVNMVASTKNESSTSLEDYEKGNQSLITSETRASKHVSTNK